MFKNRKNSDDGEQGDGHDDKKHEEERNKKVGKLEMNQFYSFFVSALTT